MELMSGTPIKVQVIYLIVIIEYIIKNVHPQHTHNSTLIQIHTKNKSFKLWGLSVQ